MWILMCLLGFMDQWEQNTKSLTLEIRQDYKDLMNVMQLDDSSSEGSSSSDEDLDFLFLEAAFPEPRLLGPRLNMEDISEIDCEQMFR